MNQRFKDAIYVIHVIYLCAVLLTGFIGLAIGVFDDRLNLFDRKLIMFKKLIQIFIFGPAQLSMLT